MRQKILVVDDMASVRMLLKLYLGSEYEFVDAVNGEEALAKAQATRPNLILLDIQMPVKDGIETLKQLKQSPATSPTPVLMVSTLVGGDDGENLRKCKALGCAGVVPKPIERDALVRAVQGALGTSA